MVHSWFRSITGIIIALVISALMIAMFVAIAGVAGPDIGAPSPESPDIAHLVRMSLIQAGLSTLLSLAGGLGIAWALNRLDFYGRGLIVSLFAAAIVAPGLVVAFGLIAVWGRSGWISELFSLFGMDWKLNIFGLGGILFAHTILNGAFAARILLARLDAIATTKLKIGQSLALGPFQRFFYLDWPAVSSTLGGLGAIIFLLAFTSFPIVLLLGGGPANQTLEVAIYAAVRLDFNLNAAVQLSIVQLLLTGFFILPALFATPSLTGAGSAKKQSWSDGTLARMVQIFVLILGVLAFGLPLLAVLVDGLGPSVLSTLASFYFWRAAATSLFIGSLSAVVTLVFAIALAIARTGVANPLLRAILGLPVFAYLVIPGVVLSLGFFLLARNLSLSGAWVAPSVLILANALLALPFAFSSLAPSISAIDKRYDRLCRALDLDMIARWRLVEWPLLGREIGIVLALGFGFSLGDLAVISLFGTNSFTTLPWAMYQALGAYRSNIAASIGAIMLLLSMVMFWLLPRLFMRWCDADN
ncbi:Thiamin ABC transporter, transmembrane component [hydrothermal vent metagenome]|uniref:Thiamin ABC transporter, transmembrane component n=1 Tax=hydrothermal vent metagenome TaxID=652676 RepID=A0A3B0TKP1_9ZZZZ